MKKTVLTASIPVLCLICACCRLPGSGGADWSVMTWNVQNLFDGIDDGTEYPEFDPSGGTWDNRLYERRLERSAEVILSAVSGGPDLIVLQELEKTEILDDLADGPLRAAGYDWRLAVDGFSIIRCGILSRHQLSEVTAADAGSWGARQLRPALVFTVESPGGPVRMAAAHWKSPRDGREATEETRRREAATVMDLLLPGDVWPGNPVMIIGDLNTPGDGGVLPGALVPWEPGIDPAAGIIFGTSEPEGAGTRGGLPVFFDPEPGRGLDGRAGSPGTYWFDGGWDRPDRALLSPEFLDGKGLEYDSCHAGGIPVMEDSFGQPRRWITDWEDGYSDHLPLILEFSILEDAVMDTAAAE